MTGNARRAITSTKPELKENVAKKTFGFASGMAGDDVPYMVYIEGGRRAGKKPPPVDALMLYVRRVVKPKAQRRGITSWVRRRNKGENAATIKGLAKYSGDRRQLALERSVAYLIARKIGKHGIKPRPIYSDALKEHGEKLPGEFRQQFRDELNKLDLIK